VLFVLFNKMHTNSCRSSDDICNVTVRV